MHASLPQVELGIDFDSDEIREQLHRILASQYFSKSKHYPAMLQYIVTKALDGLEDDIKERTLGIEVFHRPINYDTNLDPVVRITAGEIRKRLAQYYCDPNQETELRIDIPPGSYLPEFHRQSSKVLPTPILVPSIIHQASKKRRWLAYAGMSALLVLGALVSIRLWLLQTPIERFWGPFLKPAAPILICVGQPDYFTDNPPNGSSPERTTDTLGFKTLYRDRVVMGDLLAITRVTNVLAGKGQAYEIRGANSASFAEMQRGPVVLFGGWDNPWTLRITDRLRFHLTSSAPGIFRIEDRQNPGAHQWQVDFSAPDTSLKKDYAIVGRFLDSTTGQIVVVVAGVGANGTMSGGELVSNPKYLSELTSKMLADVGNVEAVIETQVIDGKSGPPVILAVHTW